MKRCLKCGQSYLDETLNFCLNDGEMLVVETGYAPPPTQFADDETPPTLVMNQPRVTNPIDWGPSSLAQQQQGMPAAQYPHYGMASYGAAKDQTLPTISLALGILSIVLVCCPGGGILLGLPAAIVGFIGLKNTDNNPAKFGGRGMAIAGMVIGIVTFMASMLYLIVLQLS